MGRHSKGQPREQPAWERPTRPQPVYEPPVRHKKKANWQKKALRALAVVLVIFTALVILGDLLPSKTANKGAPSAPNPARIVNTADILRNNSPNWYVAPHIAAVVRPEDGGKSVTLVNTGKGTASGVITLADLGIGSPAVSVWNVWTGKVSPPTVRALRVVLEPGTAMFLILK